MKFLKLVNWKEVFRVSVFVVLILWFVIAIDQQNELDKTIAVVDDALLQQTKSLIILASNVTKTLDLSTEFGYDPTIIKTTQHYAKQAFSKRCKKCLTWRFIKSPDDLTYFLLSVFKVESNGDVRSVGDSGRSFGLGQIQLPTARQYDSKIQPQELLTIEPQIRIAVAHFTDLLERYDGNYTLAVLAWNRGVGAVRRSLALGSSPENGYSYRVFRASAERNASNE